MTCMESSSSLPSVNNKISFSLLVNKHKSLNSQKTTTKLSMFWINVPKVLCETSSITSSSSPVDLFSMSHSRTSSSRDNSSAKRAHVKTLKNSFLNLAFHQIKSDERKLMNATWNESSEMLSSRSSSHSFSWQHSMPYTYFHRWLVSCVDSKPISAVLPNCIRRPTFRHESSRSRFQVDQPRRRCSRVPEGPWHICGIRACLKASSITTSERKRKIFIRLHLKLWDLLLIFFVHEIVGNWKWNALVSRSKCVGDLIGLPNLIPTQNHVILSQSQCKSSVITFVYSSLMAIKDIICVDDWILFNTFN